MDDLLLDRGHIGVVHLAAEINQQTGLLRLFLRHGLHRVKIFDSQHIRDDAGVMRRRDLCAVLPVYLVAVVLRRVVRSGDLDARLAVEIAKGEGFLRHRPQRIRQIGLNPVCRKAQRRLLRELRAHASAVIGDCDALFRIAVFNDIVRKPLRRLPDDVNIHPVCPGADHAAQSAGPERQILIEAILDFLLIIPDRKKLLFGCIVKIRIIQPVIELFHDTCFHSLILPCFMVCIPSSPPSRRGLFLRLRRTVRRRRSQSPCRVSCIAVFCFP